MDGMTLVADTESVGVDGAMGEDRYNRLANLFTRQTGRTVKSAEFSEG